MELGRKHNRIVYRRIMEEVERIRTRHARTSRTDVFAARYGVATVGLAHVKLAPQRIRVSKAGLRGHVRRHPRGRLLQRR
jgi:hypothetical protein